MKTNNSFAVLVLIIIFFILSFSSALRESLTFDEKPYIEVGIHALTKKDFSLEPYNPPFVLMLMVLPHTLGLDTASQTSPFAQQWFSARIVNILLAVLILLFTAIVATKYINSSVGVISLIFLVFDPQLLAHSHYITHDTSATLFFSISYLSVIKLSYDSSLKNFVIAGIIFAFSVCSKITTIPFHILSLFLIFYLSNKKKLFLSIQKNKKKILIAFTVLLLTVWSTYFFRSGVIVVKEYQPNRVSDKIIKFAEQKNISVIKNSMFFLQNQPVPLGDYLALIKNSLLRRKLAEKSFFFGSEYPIARPYFLPLMLIFKIPIPTLFFTIIGIHSIIKNRKKSLYYLLIPLASILLSLIFLRVNPQIRYALPIVPFVSILAGYGFWILWQAKYKIFCTAVIIWLIIRTLSFFPHFIEHANELVGYRYNYYKIFSDSNLDWGQSLPDLANFVFTEKSDKIYFSYFGRDNPREYGMMGVKNFKSEKLDEICDFYDIQNLSNRTIKIISVTNWYICGYNNLPEFHANNIHRLIGNTFLVFQSK